MWHPGAVAVFRTAALAALPTTPDLPRPGTRSPDSRGTGVSYLLAGLESPPQAAVHETYTLAIPMSWACSRKPLGTG